MPYRADGMKDPSGGQAEAGRGFGLAGGAAIEFAAGFEQLRTSRAMDGSIYASAAEERFVGSVDDGIDGELSDVS